MKAVENAAVAKDARPRHRLACEFGIVWLSALVLTPPAAAEIDWRRAAYYDPRYPTCWTGGSEVRDALEYMGYEILDAQRLKAWMNARIADGADSVVVFCQDVVPDTVVETMSATCTLRKYLNAAGKVVWYADIPIYYQGHSDGSRTDFAVEGAMWVLGFHAADAPWDSDREVILTNEGTAWGLTAPWRSVRPTAAGGLRVLARDTNGYAAAWVRHYLPGDDYRGFVRTFDQAGVPNIEDIRRVAEYPNIPEPLDLDNELEREEDIVAAFFYPWYGNPATRGQWVHWEGQSWQPPATWSSCYLPSYPDSTWNPSVQVYDSRDTQVLRWQDQAMARAGIDIAISSWWGVGGHEDATLARAIRTCKSVQWGIYYELEAYGDPTSRQIYSDIKSVLNRFGPTGNYAKVDGKWLVFVYGASGNETADRWRDAKAMLANDGYFIYVNADTGDAGPANAPDPWDAVHHYTPVVYGGATDTLPDVDDSAWISPGFWLVSDANPVLPRSLSAFRAAWNAGVTERRRHRFVLIETWNEWHEGTQIEPGQEIVRDARGYRPASYDYGYDFIDAIAPAAKGQLHWPSADHRPVAPVTLKASQLIWEPEVVKEGATECRIPAENVRIGAPLLVPESGTLGLTVRARATMAAASRSGKLPEALLFVDHQIVGQCEVGTASSALPEVSAEVQQGLHTVEIAMNTRDTTDWNLVVSSVAIQLTPSPDGGGDDEPTDPATVGFETGDFGPYPWLHAGARAWTVVSDTSHAGSYSVKAGSIGDGESTSLMLTLDCTEGHIRFWRKVSCETNWDFLEFYIDGQVKKRWSGELDWEEASYPVGAGRHTFAWTYIKDGSSSGGQDTAWIDDIAFPFAD